MRRRIWRLGGTAVSHRAAKRRIRDGSSFQVIKFGGICHVISLSEPFWPGCNYDSSRGPVYSWRSRRGAGSARSPMGALRRILLLRSGRRCARPASRSVSPPQQSSGVESTGHRRQPHLQLQPLVRIDRRRQRTLGQQRDRSRRTSGRRRLLQPFRGPQADLSQPLLFTLSGSSAGRASAFARSVSAG
jgi:hypothetical protein